MNPLAKTFVTICFFFLLISQAMPQGNVNLNLGFKLMNDQKKVSIPFETHNNLIVVSVRINEWLPLKFILDTGVRTTILTERAFSDILNLNYSIKRSILGVGGKKIIDAYVAPNVTLEMPGDSDVPGIKGQGHALLVLEKDLLQLRNYLGVEVHGILGYELFSRFIVQLDHFRQELTLIDPTYFKLKKKYRVIPIQIEDTKPYLNATVVQENGDSVLAKLMIDTGASHSLMLLDYSSDEIHPPEKFIDSNIGRGLSGDISGRVARINSIVISDYEMKGPITTFPYVDSYPDSINQVYRNGTIGGGIITRFNVIFNFPKEELYLKKNPTFNKPFNFNLSGMVIKAIGVGLNKFIVDEVAKNSVSRKAGVRKGDQILTINGRDTEHMKLSSVIGILNSKVNKRITLTLQRSGKIYKTSFRLDNIL